MVRFISQKRWLFIAFALGAGMLALPLPEGLSSEAMTVLAMTVMATTLFITQPVPIPTVALLIIIGQVLLLGIDSSEVARNLMKDSVLFIMGSLMLAVAVVEQRLDKRIALLIVSVSGTRTWRVALGLSVVSGVLASFIGEHTVAAMMLPVGITLITLSAEDAGEVRRLAAVLLLSISYGCSVAGIGTPSGGARNAIMIGYWHDLLFDPASPETARYLVDYSRWMLYAYPVFLVQLPLVTILLLITFKPEVSDLGPAITKLKAQVLEQGRMRPRDWISILLFVALIVGWVTISSTIGMGTVALIGAAMFLMLGLVRWRDVNVGVDWGVVLLYAAAISLGIQMKDSGAAAWVAENALRMLSPLGADSGVGLFAAVGALTTGVTNTMSNGAAVAVLGPIVIDLATASGESPLVIGFVTAVASAFAYLTVVATPACTIVFSSGYLKPSDFLRAGWKMVLASIVIVLLAAELYWPLLER
jgi:sodium-dependent dicarboxylate transporter 2/3/5